ncbi:E3 ubiquitin-protein ligase TRIM39-like [Rhinichthys klamathensis goyatoka]|uniref:E3 ubiquitin-protein ligase TRIM39-like n=1 Tax=Rhinichthys klamathensis goyatoka TaxID=3034132 RepID=UPI0024B589E3|nr:E3 ubiquitin-protein ligase TRIM39-like [Rhinichthys klamathensis goyatoka]XP_056115291.1 E3 ubiquitin-protein ligase TRIM39-like [Rhinichthys klamathensis goyatoka]
MASPSGLSEQCTCSICLDVFTDPVTTSCGHNFCMACIRSHRDRSTSSMCPLCGKALDSKQDFNINRTIRDIAEDIKRKRIQKKPEVSCDSCPKKKMRIAVKSCLHCGTSFCKTHLEPHETAGKLMKHKLINPVKNLDEYICKNHERPLELYCRDDQTAICQFCTESDHKNHNTVSLEEESLKLLMNKKIAVQQKIQDKLRKIKEIQHSSRFNKQAKEREIEENIKFFKDIFEKNNAELLELTEEKHKETERRGEELIRELEEEIKELKRRQTELEQLSNPMDFTQIIDLLLHNAIYTKRSSNISISAHEHGRILRKAILRLQSVLDEKMRETVGRELRSIQRYAVDVTLDPDTAHPELMLSDSGKEVWNTGKSQKIPDTPKRFDHCSCVLGMKGFSSRKFYYEVQVSGKTEWDLGVAKESIDRKGEIGLNPENGYWTVWLRNRDEYAANDRSAIPLTLKEKPVKVGVFVDFQEGLVSFYDVEARYHIYSFTGQSFPKKLYPYFSPGEYEEGQNSPPLIITPVDSIE